MQEIVLMSGLALVGFGFGAGITALLCETAVSRAQKSRDFYHDAMRELGSELRKADVRIATALANVTPKANATVRRIERILKGEAQ